jgi:pimeloyl-ACP methyl ester carboxylesterase
VVRERVLDTGRLRIGVREAGEGDPVVLLHGFPESSWSWRHQLPALAEAGYHAVAPDLRGYGATDRPEEVADYAVPELVGDLEALIGALGHERVHVVGHDWGGSVAWATASRRPELVRSLAVLNSVHPVASAEGRQDDEQRRRSWYMLLFQFTGIAEDWLSREDFANLRGFYRTAAPGTITPADEEAFVAAFRRPGALTAALNYYRANIPPESWLRPPPDLPPVTVPTLIVWGMDDAYLGPTLLERSMAKVAGPMRVERLPGVGHWVQQEAPEAVNRHLLAHLAEHR